VARKLILLIAVAAALVAGSSASALAAGGTLVAPAAVCSQPPLAAGAAAQEEAMVCFTNYARAKAGLGALEATQQLTESAAAKAGDILTCDSFSHYACGREFTYWMRQDGYLSTACWRAGENLAWGVGEYGTVASIFRAWLRSPEHRANILGDFSQVGIDLSVGRLEGDFGVHVWAAHFGSHC
jgi:uncharacterized protein YkwD